MSPSRFLLFPALFLIVTTGTQAAVLFEDDFTVGTGGYTAGSIYTQGPALPGFSSANKWSQNTGLFQATAGGALTMTDLSIASGRVTARAASFTPPTSDLWFSYSGSTTAMLNGTVMGAGLLEGDHSNGNVLWGQTGSAVTASGFMLGFSQQSTSMTAFVTYQTDAGGTPTTTTQNFGSLSPNTTYQFITQLSLNTNGNLDTLNIWVVAAGSLPSTLGAPTLTISNADISSDLNLSYLTLEGGSTAGSMGTATPTFDNMIAADSYSDMVAAPEPSAAGLLSIGLGVVLACRVFRRPKSLLVA